MQVQHAVTDTVNMVAVGESLDYVRMYAPTDTILSYSHFVEWLKANMLEEVVDDFDQHMKNLDVESMFDSFRFKDIKHPSLSDLLLGKKSYGEIVFECGNKGVFTDCDLQFILGTQMKSDNLGWCEIIAGWPEGATLKVEGTSTTKHQLERTTQEAVPVGGKPPEKIRMSLFATNGNKREDDGIRKLQPPQMTMSQDEFVAWFNTNATSANNLHTLQKLDAIVLSSPAVKNYIPEKLRFFANVRLHARHAAVWGDSNISGYLDVVVVREVDSHPGEFRQVGLFNFTTRAVRIPDSAMIGEYIDAYIHPDSRGSITAAIDTDQVFTFDQLASDLFQGIDKEGAQNLLNYQSSIRNILRRLYGKEVNPHLRMKVERVAVPVLHNNGTIDPGKITVKVFDQYPDVEQNKSLVSFDLMTGLGSDTLLDRNIELIQGVECQAAEELKKRTEAAEEQARVETLQAIQPPANASANATLENPPAGKYGNQVRSPSAAATAMTGTTFRSDSFEFFSLAITGVLPLVSGELGDRIQNTLQYLQFRYEDPAVKAQFSFKFEDGVALLIDVKERDASYLHISLTL